MINNLPEYALKYNYIVYTTDRYGDKWFYGAYNSLERAMEVCKLVDGKIN